VSDGDVEALLPEGWPRPAGYANGVSARGRLVFVAGQVGWDATGRFADGLVAQVRQALENILAVLRAGGAEPRHLVRLT
jgi:enamine deaminase RidA (YjgF/YER057c/UK114 family)